MLADDPSVMAGAPAMVDAAPPVIGGALSTVAPASHVV